MKRLTNAALAFAASCFLASASQAEIIINLTQSGTGVVASLSGSGTVNTGGGQNPGEILNFNNFSGNPFGAGIAAGAPFSFMTPLSIVGSDASAGGSPYTSDISGFLLDNAGADGSDVDLDGSFSIGDGDTYTASGSSLVTGLMFADLNVGTYVSTDTDSADFGSVTLNITAVPEPGSVALLTVAGCIGVVVARRKRAAAKR